MVITKTKQSKGMSKWHNNVVERWWEIIVLCNVQHKQTFVNDNCVLAYIASFQPVSPSLYALEVSSCEFYCLLYFRSVVFCFQWNGVLFLKLWPITKYGSFFFLSVSSVPFSISIIVAWEHSAQWFELNDCPLRLRFISRVAICYAVTLSLFGPRNVLFSCRN